MELQLLFGNNGSWLTVILLAVLFIAPIFRPKSIQNLVLFRVACVLYGTSIVVTPLLNIWLNVLLSNRSSGFPGSSSDTQFFMSAINAIGPVLMGVSVICGLFALIPATAQRRDEEGPAKHPME
jgi:hypothetical protein